MLNIHQVTVCFGGGPAQVLGLKPLQTRNMAYSGHTISVGIGSKISTRLSVGTESKEVVCPDGQWVFSCSTTVLSARRKWRIRSFDVSYPSPAVSPCRVSCRFNVQLSLDHAPLFSHRVFMRVSVSSIFFSKRRVMPSSFFNRSRLRHRMMRSSDESHSRDVA